CHSSIALLFHCSSIPHVAYSFLFFIFAPLYCRKLIELPLFFLFPHQLIAAHKYLPLL
ncbi:hypothetical protein BCV71DRAFT_270523, partial [Rhizopus microsporus]